MSIGVHDFEIPHEHVQPTRDMVIVRIPLPPKTVGTSKLIVPQVARDMMQHNVMVGRVVAMGPLAFSYKDADGLQRQNVNLGDWVTFRPFAGTMMTGGQINVNFGYRYLSSFGDVIGIIPADHMPDPENLLWEDSDASPDFKYVPPPETAPGFDFDAKKKV